MKTAALYLRVSTESQATDTQREDLLAYAKLRNFQMVEIFDDCGESGVKESRPEFDRMMKLIRRGKIDCVIVIKLDRLGRSVKHVVNTVCEMESYGIKFISVNDGIDLTTAHGRFGFHVFAAVAELERANIKERCDRGRRKAKEQGVLFGRPKTLSFFAIKELRDQGLSIAQIAERIGASKGGVHKVLSQAEDNTAVNQ